MRFLKPHIQWFTEEFFYKGSLNPFYGQITNLRTGETFKNLQFPEQSQLGNNVLVINDVPPYFKVDVRQSSGLEFISIRKYKGFLVDLAGYNNFEGYLNEQFSSRTRSKLRSNKRRLETCFNIQYKIYHGEIGEEECALLFDRARLLIEKRFAKKGERHEALRYWTSITENAHRLITSKKASLFVIYDDENPVDICYNFHYENIINHMVRSFDIDYSKFRLGHIDLYYQLEWCIKNGYRVFDFSRGDLFYKREWGNLEYWFTCHLLYPKNNFLLKITAYSWARFYELKEYLKEKKVDVIVKRARNIFKAKPVSEKNTEDVNWAQNTVSELPKKEFLIEIDDERDIPGSLRKPVYDFLYASLESFNKIRIYKTITAPQTYYVSGSKNKVKIQPIAPNMQSTADA